MPKESADVNNTIKISFYNDIRKILHQARNKTYIAVNTAMVDAYWQIGKLIVKHEQRGAERAEYGKELLKQLSIQLTSDFGRGFDVRNLRNMRAFYQTFPIRNALRTELSWTHYRSLIRIKSQKTRDWYIEETITQNWSARALERQISTLYYERLLSSKEPEPEPNHLYDLKSKLEEQQIYLTSEIDAFAKYYFNPTTQMNVKTQSKLYAYIDPAVDRFKAIETEDEKDEFKKSLRTWTNLYSFLAQVMPFRDSEFEKFYAYAKLLLNKLPKRDLSESMKLVDEVAMEYYRLQKIKEGSIFSYR